MHLRLTLRGPRRRVRLQIIDLTTPDVPPAIRHARPQFAVISLPNEANIYTAFSRGVHHYVGEDPDHAWDAMRPMVPNLLSQLPRRVREYMLKWQIDHDAVRA